MSASMKKIIMKKILYFLIAALAFVACSKDSGQGAGVSMTVKVTAGEPAETSLSFTVSSSNALNCAWMCVAKTADVPTGTEILSKGKRVFANADINVVASGLNDNTTYVIVAAALDEDFEIVTSAPIEMTTLERAPQPAVELYPGAAEGSSYSFKVTPAEADKCFFKVYEEGATATVEDVLANGVEVSATEQSNQVVENLVDGSYFIYAVAKNGDIVSELSNKIQFTINTALPTFTIEEIIKVGINANLATNGQSWIIRFYFYDQYGDYTNLAVNLETPENGHAYAPAGRYNFEAQTGYKIVSENTYYTFWDMLFTGGYVDVTINEDKTYTFNIYLVRDEDGWDYEGMALTLNWTGTVENMPIL